MSLADDVVLRSARSYALSSHLRILGYALLLVGLAAELLYLSPFLVLAVVALGLVSLTVGFFAYEDSKRVLNDGKPGGLTLHEYAAAFPEQIERIGRRRKRA